MKKKLTSDEKLKTLDALLDKLASIEHSLDPTVGMTTHPDADDAGKILRQAVKLIPKEFTNLFKKLVNARLITVDLYAQNDWPSLSFDVLNCYFSPQTAGYPIELIIKSNNHNCGIGYNPSRGESQAKENQKFFESFLSDYDNLEVKVSKKKKVKKKVAKKKVAKKKKS